MAQNPYEVQEGKSPGRAAATIQFLGYVYHHLLTQQPTTYSCIPYRATANLTDQFATLLDPIDLPARVTFLRFIRDLVFGDLRRTTRVRLRLLYAVFGVAEGGIPDDAILDRLLNLPLGNHPLALQVIHTVSLGIIGGNEPEGELVSDVSVDIGVPNPQVPHPGADPPAAGVAAVPVDNIVAQALSGLQGRPPLGPAEGGVARMPPAGNDDDIGSIESSIGTFTVAPFISGSNASEGSAEASEPKKKKHRKN
jgi:hypothetical protein